MVMFDLEEVVTIKREEWRSVETNNGGECVMMSGMKKIQLLSADNWDFQKKVDQIFSIPVQYHADMVFHVHCIIIITLNFTLGAVVITNQFVAQDSSALPFILDNVGCNGSESNLLDCLPEHNCDSVTGLENAGVQCSRKGNQYSYRIT